MDKFTYMQELGDGGYGNVWRCLERDSGDIVAIKRFKNAHTDEEVMRLALREIKLLKLIKHRNIVKLREAFRSKSGRVYLVMECVERTLTADMQRHPTGMPLAQVKLFMWQLCQAVQCLHHMKIIHRDIKPANILVGSNGVVKLCDFGFARPLHPWGTSEYSPYVVTRWYRAPEVLVGDHYGAPVDVWALGCIFAELVTGRALLPGKSYLDQLNLTMRLTGGLSARQMVVMRTNTDLHAVCVPPSEEYVTLEQRFPQLTADMVQFVKMALHPDPLKRLTAEELLALPYFDDVYKLMPQLAVMNAAAYGKGEDLFIPSHELRHAVRQTAFDAYTPPAPAPATAKTKAINGSPADAADQPLSGCSNSSSRPLSHVRSERAAAPPLPLAAGIPQQACVAASPPPATGAATHTPVPAPAIRPPSAVVPPAPLPAVTSSAGAPEGQPRHRVCVPLLPPPPSPTSHCAPRAQHPGVPNPIPASDCPSVDLELPAEPSSVLPLPLSPAAPTSTGTEQSRSQEDPERSCAPASQVHPFTVTPFRQLAGTELPAEAALDETGRYDDAGLEGDEDLEAVCNYFLTSTPGACPRNPHDRKPSCSSNASSWSLGSTASCLSLGTLSTACSLSGDDVRRKMLTRRFSAEQYLMGTSVELLADTPADLTPKLEAKQAGSWSGTRPSTSPPPTEPARSRNRGIGRSSSHIVHGSSGGSSTDPDTIRLSFDTLSISASRLRTSSLPVQHPGTSVLHLSSLPAEQMQARGGHQCVAGAVGKRGGAAAAAVYISHNHMPVHTSHRGVPTGQTSEQRRFLDAGGLACLGPPTAARDSATHVAAAMKPRRFIRKTFAPADLLRGGALHSSLTCIAPSKSMASLPVPAPYHLTSWRPLVPTSNADVVANWHATSAGQAPLYTLLHPSARANTSQGTARSPHSSLSCAPAHKAEVTDDRRQACVPKARQDGVSGFGSPSGKRTRRNSIGQAVKSLTTRLEKFLSHPFRSPASMPLESPVPSPPLSPQPLRTGNEPHLQQQGSPKAT